MELRRLVACLCELPPLCRDAMKSGDGAKPVPFPSPRFRAAAFAHRHGGHYKTEGIVHGPSGAVRSFSGARGFGVTRRGLLTDSAKIR
jgi:hypothetical protein